MTQRNVNGEQRRQPGNGRQAVTIAVTLKTLSIKDTRMCLIVFDWQPGAEQWLALAANRDEFHARPTASLHRWPGQPTLLAGQDLQQGGTWLGITQDLRFAAVTNIRLPNPPDNVRSRGELVTRYLNSTQTPAAFARSLLSEASQYGRFNLLCGTPEQLWYITNTPQPTAHAVTPGQHVLSNAWLDSDWPKARLARTQLQTWQGDQHQLTRLLNRRVPWPDQCLPDTGVTAELERLLSAQFITSARYGTRSSSSLIGRRQRLAIEEQLWLDNGESGQSRHFQVPD
tara:strand:- start:12261 stop:13115 length:855 start_codon:yes stop_codon:yes gene_type:complete